MEPSRLGLPRCWGCRHVPLLLAGFPEVKHHASGVARRFAACYLIPTCPFLRPHSVEFPFPCTLASTGPYELFTNTDITSVFSVHFPSELLHNHCTVIKKNQNISPRYNIATSSPYSDFIKCSRNVPPPRAPHPQAAHAALSG